MNEDDLVRYVLHYFDNPAKRTREEVEIFARDFATAFCREIRGQAVADFSAGMIDAEREARRVRNVQPVSYGPDIHGAGYIESVREL
jgi:hypothetical protein